MIYRLPIGCSNEPGHPTARVASCCITADRRRRRNDATAVAAAGHDTISMMQQRNQRSAVVADLTLSHFARVRRPYGEPARSCGNPRQHWKFTFGRWLTETSAGWLSSALAATIVGLYRFGKPTVVAGPRRPCAGCGIGAVLMVLMPLAAQAQAMQTEGCSHLQIPMSEDHCGDLQFGDGERTSPPGSCRSAPTLDRRHA
jgi:hypothetical protein